MVDFKKLQTKAKGGEMSEYKIESILEQFNGEADKGIERTCGNCFYYIEKGDRCIHPSGNLEDCHRKTDTGCWYHSTHAEHKRLSTLIKGRSIKR